MASGVTFEVVRAGEADVSYYGPGAISAIVVCRKVTDGDGRLSYHYELEQVFYSTKTRYKRVRIFRKTKCRLARMFGSRSFPMISVRFEDLWQHHVAIAGAIVKYPALRPYELVILLRRDYGLRIYCGHLDRYIRLRLPTMASIAASHVSNIVSIPEVGLDDLPLYRRILVRLIRCHPGFGAESLAMLLLHDSRVCKVDSSVLRTYLDRENLYVDAIASLGL